MNLEQTKKIRAAAAIMSSLGGRSKSPALQAARQRNIRIALAARAEKRKNGTLKPMRPFTRAA